MQERLFRLLYLFDRHERSQIGILLMGMLLGAGLETFSVGIIPLFVALLNDPQLLQKNTFLQWLYPAVPSPSLQQFLLIVSIFLLAVYLFKNFYLAALTYGQYYFLYRKQVSLSGQLLSLYLYSPYTFHLQRNSADLIRNMTSEITQIFTGVLIPGLIVLTEIMVITAILGLLAVVEPISSAIAASFIGILIFLLNLTILDTPHA